MAFRGGSLDEQEAASIVAGLHSRGGDNNGNDGGVASAVDLALGVGDNKRPHGSGDAFVPPAPAVVAAAAAGARARAGGGTGKAMATTMTPKNNNNNNKRATKKRRKRPAATTTGAAAPPLPSRPLPPRKDPPLDATGLVFAQPELKPPPYFYYSDHSVEEDDDPLTPITTAGSVPTFPAKMHAILTNPKLADIVAWAPHGRSWQILNPRDFEILILPRYFEHSKFSSFVRQANGWGFRRVAMGYGKNAYYHEYFLRSMPWLCKKMRRPKVAEKKAIDPDMEPDFDAISREHPVRTGPPTREVLVVQRTIEIGPKARMPVVWDTGTPRAAPSSPATVPSLPPPPAVPALALTASAAEGGGGAGDDDDRKMPAGAGGSCGDLKPAALPGIPITTTNNGMLGNAMGNCMQNDNGLQQQHVTGGGTNPHAPVAVYAPAATIAPPQTSYPPPAAADPDPPSRVDNRAPPPAPPSSSDSHFAAGFMAATAYHSEQIRSMLSAAFAAGVPLPDGAGGVVVPSAPAAALASSAAGAAAANLGNALDLLRGAGAMTTTMASASGHHHHHHHHRQPTPATIPPAATQASNNLGNAFEEMLRRASYHQNQASAGRGGDPYHHHHPQGNSTVNAAAAGGHPMGFNGGGPIAPSYHQVQLGTPSYHQADQAMQRLQQFQAYQAAMGDAPQYQYPPGNF